MSGCGVCTTIVVIIIIVIIAYLRRKEQYVIYANESGMTFCHRGRSLLLRWDDPGRYSVVRRDGTR